MPRPGRFSAFTHVQPVGTLRSSALLKDGNKSDRIDARKLAELLRTSQLKAVYHEEQGVRTLKELGRSYLTITKDVTRVMNRIKALYRSPTQTPAVEPSVPCREVTSPDLL